MDFYRLILPVAPPGITLDTPSGDLVQIVTGVEEIISKKLGITSMNNTRQQGLSGYLFALGATAIWSGNFIVARGMSEIVPPISLAFCQGQYVVIST